MLRRSAGLLMYRILEGETQVFLVHPGGPFWSEKDRGAWSIPKGEYEANEAPLDAAQREFREETGFEPTGQFRSLGQVRQAGGKTVTAWAFEGDFDPVDLTSNMCQIEWPPRSGKQIEILEIDRGEWFALARAREYILKSQQSFLDRFAALELKSS